MKTEQEQLKKSLRGEKTKELIIDCINVNECEFYGYDGICKLYSGSNCSKDCSKYPNCNYKQLKRAEEEINGYKTIIEKIRQEVQEDVTCESRECGCDSYEECIECLKNTILNIINEERNDFVQGRVICKECGKYKQALDDIKKIVQQTCNDCSETRKHCGYGAVLSIINQAKKGN